MNDTAGGQQQPEDRPGLMMGRLFGVPVHVSPSWLLVAAFITIIYAPMVGDQVPGIGGARYLVAFFFAVLLYLSVLIHELSHSVVAKAFGLPVRRITLYMLGGVSEIEREPQTPGREFLVAFAGPLLSFVIAAAGFAGYHALTPGTVTHLLVFQLTWANLIVGVFNMLPGLPLDGGRMLRAGVWKVTSRPVTATLVAAWAGRVLGVGVFLVPLLLAAAWGGRPSISMVVWAALIGSFIWVGASQSLRVAKLRERLPQVCARSLARRAVPVTADLPLSEALRRAYDEGARAIVVVSHEGKPVAIVNETAVTATPVQRRPWVSVGSMSRMIEPGLVLSADLAGRDLVMSMQHAPASEYLLVEPGGEVYGVLTSSDVDRAFAGV